jgi:DNA-binding CsgD family transcriptional regulator
VISLVGRTSEQAELGRLVEQARHGRSGVLVVRGEAGIGKTALLDAAASSATGFDVVRLVGIESEMRLGFAALHQLLTPFLDRTDALPPPQARALRAAFGISDDEVPDQFLVGLAALTLLSAAATRPLLIVIDDTQWLDQESADALGFLARRLHADPVCLLASVRDPNVDRRLFEGLPSLTLGPLSDAASVVLLDAAVPKPLAGHVRVRLLAEARGNPLALVEFGRELSPDQLAGVAPLPEALAVDRRLERHFLRQVLALPTPTRRLLLVAAAEPTGDARAIWQAGSELDFDESAVEAARSADLVETGPHIAFRHPLIRSAVYQGASDADRRRAHAALAHASDVAGDSDRRAWHRAAAARSPDAGVALELDQAARRARRRGSCAASADLLTRAAQLTPDARQRAALLVRAASADVTAGNPARAQANLAHALPDLRDPLLAARARQLQASIAFLGALQGPDDGADARTQPGDSVSMMLDAARAFEPLDPGRARDAAFDALQMAVYSGGSSTMSTAQVAQVAGSFAPPPAAVSDAAELALDAIAGLLARGYGASPAPLRDALTALRHDPVIRGLPRHLARACWIAFALGDDDAAHEWGAACAESSREQGAFRVLPEGLDYLGVRELRVGSLDAAEDYLSEVVGIHEVPRRYRGPGEPCRLMVSAWRGREADVRARAAELASDAPPLGIVAVWTDHAVMTLELGLGNYQAASTRAHGAWNQDVMFGGHRAADAVEAHVRSGNRDAASAALAHLTERAAATQSDLDRGLLARSRGLLAGDTAAEAHYGDSIARLEAYGAGVHLARSHLVYGEWLRRQKRRRDARVHLEAARAVFAAAGADGFAERARVELLATGARARRRVDETRLDLTPQEWQISRMVAAGATNLEIGERLFISASTVDYHLRKVYRKLGVRTRHELTRAVSAD